MAQFYNKENNLEYNLDIYVNNLNEIPSLFQKDKVFFGFLTSEEAEKLKEIFGWTSAEFANKYQLYHHIKLKNDENEIKNIIIDNGSFYIKAGISEEEGPRAVFPSCVGHPKYLTNKGDIKEFFVGQIPEYIESTKNINYIYPIINGLVNDWDDQEKIWGHIFTNELRVAPAEHNILISEVPMNPKENREITARIMFETFNVPGLYIANQAVLSLYSTGIYTGVSADLGGGVSHFVPVFDGYALQHATISLDLGGKDLTEYMLRLLKGYNDLLPKKEAKRKKIVEDIKDKSCYVALDFEEELNSVEGFDYHLYYLPDNNFVYVRNQRIECPEVLFKPYMAGKEGTGIAQACCDSILKTDLDLRKDFYNHIVLSGGTSMFKGLPERFTKEIKYLAPESMKDEVNVFASPYRNLAVWIGGSNLSSLPIFESMIITKKEYEEYGATIVHRKCF